MADNQTVLTVVALPFALWALERAIEGTFRFRQTIRSRYLDTIQLLDDIESNLEATSERIGILQAELEGSPSPIEDKTAKDKDYVLFTVWSDVTFVVFEADAVQRFSHLDSTLFARLKRFYDLQKLIAATYKSAASDLFKGLTPARKVRVFQSLLQLSQKGQAVGADCTSDLELEIRRISASFLWKALILRDARSDRSRARSAVAATSRSPSLNEGSIVKRTIDVTSQYHKLSSSEPQSTSFAHGMS